MHLLPADFSGPNGEIRDTIYLDVLDDLLAQCRDRGIYVYLTLMNEMNTSFCRRFIRRGTRASRVGVRSRSWLPNQNDTCSEFLDRMNRYTGCALCR